MAAVTLTVAVMALLVTAWLALRSADSHQARRWGIGGTVTALGASLLYAAGPGLPNVHNDWSGLPAFVSTIGLIAVALNPVRGASPATFGRILIMTAVSVLAEAVKEPVDIIFLWALAALPVWAELRARPEHHGSARVFALYMLPSILITMAGWGLHHLGMTGIALGLLALGIAVREGLLPFHSWFPELTEQAPLGTMVAFVAPQLGIYTLLQLLSDTLPPDLGRAIAVLGALTALYGAAMGMVQRGKRRALSYLIISQSGLVVLALVSGSELARMGALLMWLVGGLAQASFAMAVAALEARRGSLHIDGPNGSASRVPRLAAAYLILGLACVGLPGTIGFVATDLVVQGAVEGLHAPGLVLILASAMNGIAIARSYFMLFAGRAALPGEQDLTRRETWVFSLVFAVLVTAGLYPTAILGSLSGSAERSGAAPVSTLGDGALTMQEPEADREDGHDARTGRRNAPLV